MKIGLDFDGVIAYSGESASQIARDTLGIDIMPSLFNSRYLKGNGILTKEQYEQVEQIFYIEHELDSLPGMEYYIKKLLVDGHDVQVVTSRSVNGIERARNYLEAYGISIPFVAVGKRDKSRHLCGFDVFVDNDYDKLEYVVGVVPELFLFDWPYNHHFEESFIGAKRAYSWGHLYSKIQALHITGREE